MATGRHQKNLSPREELLKLQRKIFARNQKIIHHKARVAEKGFDAYEKSYLRRVRDFERPASLEEFVSLIKAAEVVYVGDYHTNPQSQRTLLRLLKRTIPIDPDLALCVEIVESRHQHHLDDYFCGKISEGVFLKKIGFEKNWSLALWKNFKPILDFAREYRVPVFGVEYSLSGKVPLVQRDAETARTIAGLIEKHHDKKFFVFVGDLHVAPAHLPDRVATVLAEHDVVASDLILYQNSEAIYWKLAEAEMEHLVEIVKISDREFCIINTPPILWQQSFLNWLDPEDGEIEFGDARPGFLNMMARIAEFLDLCIPEKALKKSEEVEVFTSGDLSFLDGLKEDGEISAKDLRQIKRQILDSESYCIPHRNYVYLGNLSVNHVAEEAAHYLKYLCSGRIRTKGREDDFYAKVIEEALGFFGSKIVNHKRKCFHEKEYRSPIRRDDSVSRLILRHRDLDRRGSAARPKSLFPAHPHLAFNVAHGLGYMLGDRLYYGLIENVVDKEEAREIFIKHFGAKGAAYALYKKLDRKLRSVKIPGRV